ncbi:hypothetical protein F5X68DRAFT_274060 [Plectosphaerella plurivora]|uniref:Heterokaryon incompatibility domain-containing protein n=1 Tax=Plectosphaerella plurivora TaxID=936078 RepID=A0A9P9AFA7_9PEZI|nr:hypothetical protein F5X68DRAFT_274060 [Plectosphaerella plurivora]
MKISMTPGRAGAALLALAKKKVSRKERTLTDPESKLVELYAQHGDKFELFTRPLLEAVELLLHESTFEDYYRTENNIDYPIAEDFIEKNASAGNLGPEHLLKVIAMAASVSDKHDYHMKGGADFVKRLIELGAPVNGIDSDGKPPLYFACRFGGPKIFDALIEAGADTEVTCEDLLPAPDIDGKAPMPRCNLLKLALDGKYLGSKHQWAYEGQDSVYFEIMRWDNIITTLLLQGRSFDPGHPMIAHHLQIACSMGRTDLINIILRPDDAVYQASLVDIPMVQGLTLPAAMVSAARAGRPAIVETMLSLGADPRTPFPLESAIPAPFEWKRLFNRPALTPLAPPHALFSHFPRFHGGHKWDDIAKSLEHMIIAGTWQPDDAVFKEDCEKLLQGFIAHGCVLPAGRLLAQGFRPLDITFCTSPAALDLCVQYGISSLVNWQTVLSHACHEGKTDVFRAVVKHAPGLWKDYDDMMECARRFIDKPDLVRCFIDHCGLDIDYVGEQEAFREDPRSSLLSSAIVDIYSKRTTPTIQMLVSLGANTDMPGLPFNAKEALWNATKGRNRCGVSPVEGFRENILPAIRAICGNDMPYPPGWPHVEDLEDQQEGIRPVTLPTDHPAFLNVRGYDPSMSNLMSLDSEMPDVEQCDNARLPEIPSLTSEREAIRGLDGSPYHFVSLGGFSNGIRLLHLEPATTFEAPIQSSFIRCSLAEAPSFQVLTGCWGATKAVEFIGIDDGFATVSADLSAALRRVRSSSTPVMLWSRGLCINYQDIDEANKQLTLVRDVHLSAQRLLVWLGEATDGANIVFDFLDKNVFNLPDEHAVNPGNRFDGSLQGASMRRPCDMSLSDPMDEYDGSTPVGYRPNTGGLFYPADVGAAYEQLCLRPWFYTPWTETEIVLCDQMTLLCGPYRIASGPSGFDNILREMDAPYMYKPMAKVRTPNERPVVSTGPRHLYELSSCRTRLARCSDPLKCAEIIASRLAWGPYTRSDPRETVFATAALSAKSLFVMDYRDSIAVVLRKVTEAMLDRQLKVLLHYGFNNKVIQGLPSWVPDLTHPEDMNVLYKPFSFWMKPGPHIQCTAPRVEGDNLILQGLCIEKIHAVGVVMQDHDPLVLHDWENVAASMPRTSVIDSITEAFMHTLVASTGSGRHVRVESFRRWYTIHGSGKLRVADAEWFEACELAEAWSGPSYQRQLQNNTYRIKQRQDDLERYERGVWAMGRGRRFFVTDRGNMGLGPGGAAVGDVVMQPLTLTITQPFSYVLTPREDGLYGFKGASCLYSADAIPRFEKKEVVPMDFVIR